MFVAHPNQPVRLRQCLLAVLCVGAVVWAQTPENCPEKGGCDVFDRAVASVEGRVITLSQLDFEARVLLVNAGGVGAAFAKLDKEVLVKSLATLIDERLATREADQLDAYPLESGELEREIARFRGRFRDEGEFRRFLQQHEADLDSLSAVLRRSLRAQHALEGKLRLKAQVTEEEARRYQLEHSEVKSLSLDAVRQKLFATRFAALAHAELAQARKRADVRLLGPYASMPGVAP